MSVTKWEVLMKKIALILTVLMILSAGTALAQQGAADAPIITTYDVVAAADKQLNEAESFAMDMKLVLAMSAEGESVAVAMDAGMKFILDPLTMQLVLDAATIPEIGEKISAEIYLRTEDGALVIYGEAQGEAFRVPLGSVEELTAMFTAMLSEMGISEEMISAESAVSTPEDYERLAYIGESTVNGKKVYVIEMEPRIPVKEMQEIFDAMGMGELFSEAGVNMSTFLSAYEDLTYTYYIDKATYQYVRMEMDLTGVMRRVMANMGLLEDVDVNINEYSVVIDIKDINKVKPFDVPKRILNNAEDLGGLFGAGSMGIIGGSDGPTSVIVDDGYFDQIDWEDVAELDDAEREAFMDADGNIDYAALAEAYPAA